MYHKERNAVTTFVRRQRCTQCVLEMDTEDEQNFSLLEENSTRYSNLNFYDFGCAQYDLFNSVPIKHQRDRQRTLVSLDSYWYFWWNTEKQQRCRRGGAGARSVFACRESSWLVMSSLGLIEMWFFRIIPHFPTWECDPRESSKSWAAWMVIERIWGRLYRLKF